MAQLTEFGKNVKFRLIEMGMTQEELMKLVREQTGMFVDSSYMWKILHGERGPDRLVDAIKRILSIN